ncbi:unnamed protein product [Nesidiocoris tenuis]|uniref:Ig-like domain-containing protein n=1 Tax=Nesidiocoris tenuis TaxID=355587 RepID=A0A6H5GPV2_9HEMI|nr:unnamed protein product [Nesidiocoris tenuis]
MRGTGGCWHRVETWIRNLRLPIILKVLIIISNLIHQIDRLLLKKVKRSSSPSEILLALFSRLIYSEKWEKVPLKRTLMPPDKLAVLDEKGAHIPHYILGPYNEGATVDITCISTGGRPLPRVTWWQENALLDDSYEVISDRKVKNVLRVSQLERRHLHAVFTCQASNNNYLAPISSSVTLDLNRSERSFRKNFFLYTFTQNHFLNKCLCVRYVRYVRLSVCPSVRLSVCPSVVIYKNGHNSLISQPFFKFLELKCLSQQDLTPCLIGIWITHSTSDIFAFLVTLQIATNMKKKTMSEEFCKFCTGGNIVVNNPSGGIILANQSLVLQSVDRSKGGLYTCVASNGEGDGESNPLLLNIKFSPVCRPGQGNVVGVGKGETAKIPCEVEANPPSTDFTWRFNNTGESIEIAGNQFSSEPNHSVITYTPHTEHDFGTLLCWARNPLGTMGRPCAFHIIPAGRPDTLLNCTLVNQTETALGIECSEGFDGGLPQYFLVEVFSQGTGKAYVSNVTSASPSLTVTGLPPGGTYEVHAYAVNAKGRSDATVLHAYTLKSPQKQTVELRTAATRLTSSAISSRDL